VIKTQSSVQIDRAAASIYSFVVDDFVTNYPRWSPEVKSLKPLSEGPLATGWKARQVRVDQGRKTATDFEVVALEKPSHVAFRGLKDPYHIDFRLIPESENHTQLIFAFELGQLGMAFRPFEKLIRHAVQSGVDRVTTNLKALIEAEVSR
jgi:Polyketide cyclase / dehydrase and lipid transport.